jgi:hypothetical protein
MFGAPFGGTIRAGQAAFDCKALSSISPLNGGGGAGTYLPSMVVVALGEPGTPVVFCCALALITATIRIDVVNAALTMWADLAKGIFPPFCCLQRSPPQEQ